jgi:hypothetical protein
MVQIMDPQKTLDALHFACALARGQQTNVVLVKMVAVEHLSWLGTELGEQHFTDDDNQALRGYREIASGYDVGVETQTFQYTSFTSALVQAADYVDAQIVFAELPPSTLPLWYRFRAWLLRRCLAERGGHLYLLEHGNGPTAWTPSLLVPAVSSRRGPG